MDRLPRSDLKIEIGKEMKKIKFVNRRLVGSWQGAERQPVRCTLYAARCTPLHRTVVLFQLGWEKGRVQKKLGTI